MPGIAVVIALRRRDAKIKKWFEQATENDVNISHLVQCAIEYYARTGEYLFLGSVTTEDKEYKDARKCLSIPQRGYVRQYLVSKEEEGISSGKIIKRILEKGISVDDKTQSVTTNMEAEDILENICRKKEQGIPEDNGHVVHSSSAYPAEEKIEYNNIKEEKSSVYEQDEEEAIENEELSEEEDRQKAFLENLMTPKNGLGVKLS